MREKQKASEWIIFLIEILGQFGLPLRGHRDSGTLPMPQPGSSDIDYT